MNVQSTNSAQNPLDLSPPGLAARGIEIIRPLETSEPLRHALFDFDGTLSLVREGWIDIMVPMMVDELANTGTDESVSELTEVARTFVAELTGKQTIYQMIRLAEEIANRGGSPQEPVLYKHRYHDLLMQRIAARRQGLSDGTIPAKDLLVPGSRELLEALRDRGIALYLASGTDEVFVKEEAELLGLTEFFGQHIYGAVDDYKTFSKAQVIQRILKTTQADPRQLVGFGDGYVEIQNVKQVGGIAVGVASDEANRSGKCDPWKRDRLIGVGADLIVPDFSQHEALIGYLLQHR